MKLLTIIALAISASANAQYTTLQSQYMFNSVALNPAATGSEGAMSVVGTFRAQWVGFSGAPTTEAITLHAPLRDKNSAVGLQIFADQIGVDRNTGIFGTYSYKLLFKSASLRIGAAAGVNLIQSNYNELDVAQAGDIQIATNTPLGILPDFSLGLHYSADKYFASFSIPMFLSHDFDETKFRLRNDFSNYNFILGGGYVFDLPNTMKLKPSALLKFRRSNRPQFDLNAKLQLNPKFDVGLSYRTEEAIVGLFEARITNQFSVMYSFGAPINSIIKYSFGSHELSVKYNFLYKKQIESPRFLGW